MCSASIIFRKKMHITKNIKTVSRLSARHEKQEWLLVEVYKHVEWNKETNKAIKLCALCDRYENILFYFISYTPDISSLITRCSQAAVFKLLEFGKKCIIYCQFPSGETDLKTLKQHNSQIFEMKFFCQIIQ